MKTIQPISIWDNGQTLEAKVLNSYASNVVLGLNATFYYNLMTTNEDGSLGFQLRQGYLLMEGEAYSKWEVDAYAWDWVAKQLKLTITGDYIAPVPPQLEPTPEPFLKVTEEVIADEAP